MFDHAASGALIGTKTNQHRPGLGVSIELIHHVFRFARIKREGKDPQTVEFDILFCRIIHEAQVSRNVIHQVRAFV